MKSKLIYSFLIIVFSLQWSACTTSRALVDYNSIGNSTNIQVNEGGVNGRSLGIAKGDEGGAIWADCTEKAEESMKELLLEAKEHGANAIGDIKWYATHNSEPGCKKGWGYLMVWPFVLTPLFMSTEVEAHMYKIEGGKRNAKLILLPKTQNEEENLVKRLVLGSRF